MTLMSRLNPEEMQRPRVSLTATSPLNLIDEFVIVKGETLDAWVNDSAVPLSPQPAGGA
jgi:hypothetical protein